MSPTSTVAEPTSPSAAVDGRRTGTKDRLVAVALELFATQGYEGTRVADIEGAAGLRPGAGGMYRHFASKEELLLAAVTAYRDRVRALRDEMAAGDPAEDPAVDLRRLVAGFAGFLRGERTIVRLSAGGAALPKAARTTIGQAWDEAYGTVVDLIERRGVPVDDPEAVAVEAIGALDHYFGQLGLWAHRPLRVAPDRFLTAWVDRWSAVLAG